MFLCPRTAVFPVCLGPVLLVPQERIGDLRWRKRKRRGEEEGRRGGEKRRGEEEDHYSGLKSKRTNLLKTGSLCSSMDDSCILSMID